MPTHKPSIRVDEPEFAKIVDLGAQRHLDNNDIVAVALDAFVSLNPDQQDRFIERRRFTKRHRDGRRNNRRQPSTQIARKPHVAD